MITLAAWITLLADGLTTTGDSAAPTTALLKCDTILDHSGGAV